MSLLDSLTGLARLRSYSFSVGLEGPLSSAEYLCTNWGVVCIWLRDGKVLFLLELTAI